MFLVENYKQRILKCLPPKRPYKVNSLKNKYFELIFDVCIKHLPFTHYPVKVCLNNAFRQLKYDTVSLFFTDVFEFEQLITDLIFNDKKLDFRSYISKQKFSLLIKTERVKIQNWYDSKAKQVIPDVLVRLNAVIKNESKAVEYVNKALELFEQRNDRPKILEKYLQAYATELLDVCNSRRVRITLVDLFPEKYDIE